MKKVIIEIALTPESVVNSGEKSAIETEIRKKINEFHTYDLIKKSIDARNKKAVLIRFRCAISIDDEYADHFASEGFELYSDPSFIPIPVIKQKHKAIIAGMGPAGLFCAHRLTEAGVDVTIIERGKPISERDRDVELLKKNGILNEESNVVFGEGGAGTYSDGKLTTRIHKGPVDSVFRTLIEYGAPENILYDAKPHIGTDILSEVITSMRRSLLDKGTEILFSEKVTGLIAENGKAAGVVTSHGNEYRADSVIIATGHSARDTYKNLVLSGICLEKKGFAAGFRIEHPAEFINRTQYGSYAEMLPAADYRLAFNNPETGRGVYSFCMCPGGEVINSSSEKGMLCVNGMSMSARNGIFSNAAIVVSLNADDFPGDILSGIEFQRDIEKKAFFCASGGSKAPAQKASDFLKGVSSGGKIEASFLPSVVNSDLSSVFPLFMKKELIKGLKHFNRLMPGFIENGVCIGVESRTSSPVRITRTERMESVSVKNLYPIGEGAGYAGGIVSSAVDGLKCADMIISGLSF